MDDISDDTKFARRHAEITSVVRRRRWSDEEKGRIVAEAIAPGAVIADVAHVGVELRQSYARVGKLALIKHQRYAHAHQFKRANPGTRHLAGC